MKKIISIIIIVTLLTANIRTVYANPGALVIGGIAATGALLLSGATAKYFAPAINTNPFPSTMKGTGTVGTLFRAGVATWHASTQYGTDKIYGKYVALKASCDDIGVALDHATSGAYANLKALFHFFDDHPNGPTAKNAIVGDAITDAGVPYHVNSTWTSPHAGCQNSLPANMKVNIGGGLTQWTFYELTPGDGSCWDAHWVSATNFITSDGVPHDPGHVLDVAAAAALMRAQPGFYDNEIDALIHDAPNIFSAVDTVNPDTDSSAPPFLPTSPPGENTTDGTASPTTTAPTTAAANAASSAAATKAEAATAAATAVNDYKASHPDSTVLNDTNLANLVKASEAAAAAATAATTVATTIAAENSIPMPDVTPSELKVFSWAKLHDLQGVLVGKFPFSLITPIKTLFNGWVYSEVHAPSFDLPLGGSSMHIDLSMFDTIALIWRYFLSIFMFMGVTMMSIRFVRGIE